MNDEVKTQERGWAGHYIGAYRCRFRRNTLITYKNLKWVVSTVGNKMRVFPPDDEEYNVEIIGHNRWYETMVFESSYDEYDDIDINSKEIEVNSDWGIWGKTWEEVLEKYGYDIDNAANRMHDRIVEEMKVKIKEAAMGVRG